MRNTKRSGPIRICYEEECEQKEQIISFSWLMLKGVGE